MEIDLEPTAHRLRVRFPGGVTRDFTWRWLRDHGEDALSLDPVTRQRLVDTFSLPAEQRARSASVVGADLVIAWPDGSPTTAISISLLARVSGVVESTESRRSWTAATCPRPAPTAAFVDLVGSDDVLAASLVDLHRHGFTIVTDVPESLTQTALLISRFGPVRNTVFGDVWSVEAGVDAHADSAYRSSALEPHTDGTYSNEAPGLQVLHVTRPADRGGETVLVDGLAVHEQLCATTPEQLVTLTRVAVPARYIEPGVDLRAERPAIRVDADGRLLQLSFNNYDRAPMWLPPDEMQTLYAAYAALHERIIDPDNGLARRVEAGEALVVDNWRVLHGRRAFTGERRFQGGYVNHEDVESRRRTTGQMDRPVS